MGQGSSFTSFPLYAPPVDMEVWSVEGQLSLQICSELVRSAIVAKRCPVSTSCNGVCTVNIYQLGWGQSRDPCHIGCRRLMAFGYPLIGPEVRLVTNMKGFAATSFSQPLQGTAVQAAWIFKPAFSCYWKAIYLWHFCWEENSLGPTKALLLHPVELWLKGKLQSQAEFIWGYVYTA